MTVAVNESIVLVSNLSKVPQGMQIDIDPSSILTDQLTLLRLQRATEKDWVLIEENDIPPMQKKYVYENGVMFLSEVNRLVLADSNPTPSKNLAKRMLAVVSDFRPNTLSLITAIGINFTFLIPNSLEKISSLMPLSLPEMEDFSEMVKVGWKGTFQKNENPNEKMNLTVQYGDKPEKGLLLTFNFDITIVSPTQVKFALEKAVDYQIKMFSYLKHFEEVAAR